MFSIYAIKLLMCMFLVMDSQVMGESANALEYRSRRQVNSLPLVYPYGAVSKFIIGLSVPIEITDGINVGFGANLQFQYQQIQNISTLSQYYFIKTVSREERDLELAYRADERLIFYNSVTNIIQSKGMNGRECMLRAICEAAQYPVEEEGLIGEIIHILLTPDYGRPVLDKDAEWEDSMSLYRDAATAGRQMFSCPDVYSGCPNGEGFFELISELREE